MTDAFDPFAEDENSTAATNGDDVGKGWTSDFGRANATNETDLPFTATQASFSILGDTGPVFPDDPMALAVPRSDSPDSTAPVVHIAIHEQLTGMYDGAADLPTARVEGSVYVRAENDEPFCLKIHDPLKHIQKLKIDETMCEEVMPKKTFLAKSIRTIQVHAYNETGKKRKILTYACNTEKVQPIPLLVKSKVQVAGFKCRVGVKIRSNPENSRPLKQMAVIMSVPPDIRGETVKLSRKGGQWDAMKRIVSWKVEVMNAGDLIEIQAQFECLGMQELKAIPKFPILVRCDADDYQFSEVELRADGVFDIHQAVRLNVNKTARILQRKI